ncbi:hypothetical protein L6164_007313 [Bauhinia variegata]|uniref:Uncharacterized protein n=1 Tax=Bauhinia variegata TaxID=167791 RepID=A0ACB9PDH8_BAUVA|nr:hypothetical protein L6164_007313 [Bauhinia variegata]
MDEMNKIDDVILPGFRFHPTDEELVDFYLRRKIQQQPLSIELIKQVDIYKYDPWDLPKLANSSAPPKKLLDKTLPANDSWAICRIFKKANMSMAQKALCHSWMNQLPESMVSDMLGQGTNSNQFISSENISCRTEIASAAIDQFFGSNELHQQVSSANLTACSENAHIFPSYKPINNSTVSKSSSQFPVLNGDFGDSSFIFSTLESSTDASSMLFNPDRLSFEGPNPAPSQWGITGQTIGFPFSLPPSDRTSWKATLPWDSPSPPCPSDMSTSYSTNKCYT